jgi:hypothetical protein
MNWWQRLRRRERLEDELDAELEFHVDQLVTDLMRDGLTEREARRQAAREFGYVQEIKDDCAAHAAPSGSSICSQTPASVCASFGRSVHFRSWRLDRCRLGSG